MSDEMKQPQGGEAYDKDVMAALTKIMGDAGKKLIGQTEAQQIALMALKSIVVASPVTATLNQDRLAAVLYSLGGATPGAAPMLKKVSAYLGMLVTMAQKLPELEAEAKALAAAEEAKEKASEKPK
jgi:hypothetical protein